MHSLSLRGLSKAAKPTLDNHWVISLTRRSLSGVRGKKVTGELGDLHIGMIQKSPKVQNFEHTFYGIMATENTYISILHLLWLGDNRCEISKEIVHTVSQIARNPWSNTKRGHLLEANWSNNFEFIQRFAKSLWILKDTEIKSPLTRL